MTERNRELTSSYCLSLGCYPSRDLGKLTGSRLREARVDDDETRETIFTSAISSLPSVWPQNGGLNINVDFGGRRKDLPLSPPFVASYLLSWTEGLYSNYEDDRSLETAGLIFQNLSHVGKIAWKFSRKTGISRIMCSSFTLINRHSISYGRSSKIDEKRSSGEIGWWKWLGR